jgi:hypothetical protein
MAIASPTRSEEETRSCKDTPKSAVDEVEDRSYEAGCCASAPGLLFNGWEEDLGRAASAAEAGSSVLGIYAVIRVLRFERS